MIQPVILSGGKGSRLWPLSREQHPKQFLNVRGNGTLFQQTVRRIGIIPDVSSTMVLCNNDHRFLVAEQLRERNHHARIVLEPTARDTAPALCVAALLCREEDPVLLILPADHVISNDPQFAEAVAKAAPLARNGDIVTLGVRPGHAEPNFGYLRAGAPVGDGFQVDKFTEKPDQQTAQVLLSDPKYFWNSGIFLTKASTLYQELQRFEPEIVHCCDQAVAGQYNDLDFIRLDREAFSRCPAKSIDYAVMERTERCRMVPLDAEWSDLGSWSAMRHSAQDKDAAGNVLRGDVLAQDCTNCYLHSQKRLLAAVGLQDIIAVETPDAILVGHKDKMQHVRDITQQLKTQHRTEALAHTTEYRPWGGFECIATEHRFQVKRIQVKPGHILSLQMHHHRAEHWIIVKGTAKVRIGDNDFLLTEDQSTYIPIGQVHRLENPGKVPLELIEIQTGSYLGEDDIVRFEDVYGR